MTKTRLFLMLMSWISLSIRAEESPKSYFQLKPGESTKVEAWCFDSKKMTDLRNAVESCEADRIELKNQRELNSKLVNTSSPEKAIWQEWWVKLPVGLLIGTLAGSIAGKQLESYVVGGLAGGLAGATSTVILDMKF